MTVELKFLGKKLKVYNGTDGGVALHLQAGDVVGVSDEKAKRLLADFPHDFEATSGPRQAAPVERKVVEPSTEEDEPTGKAPKKNKALTPKKNKRK